MDVLIVGAGGHGRVVLDLLRAANRYKPVGFLDADVSLAGTQVGGVEVLGPVNLLPKLRRHKIRAALVAIGDNRTRIAQAQLLREHDFELINAIHPAAVLSTTAQLGVNTVAAAGAVIGAESTVGDSVIINTSAVVDHECRIGEGAHIAPGALLGGRVRIGAGAFVGLGAKILPCLSIGDHATIGAGAVVLKDVPAGATVVGVPGRIIKQKTPQ